jgi:hypothetical protein
MTTAPVGFHCPACVTQSRREARRHQVRGVRRRLTTARSAVGALVVVGLVGGLCFLGNRLPNALSADDHSYADDSFVGDDDLDLSAGPFDGTPAEDFAEAADGWITPRTITFAGWTSAQTTTGVEQVHEALSAMFLDRQALVAHDPSAVLLLLAPSYRPAFAKGYTSPQGGSANVLVSGRASLAGFEPRVQGRTTVRVASEKGRHPLDVTTEYVVVYPFEVQDFGPGSRTAAVRFAFTWRIHPPGEAAAEDRGLTLTGGSSALFHADCAEAARGLLAPDTEELGIDPESFYDLDLPIDAADTCGA